MSYSRLDATAVKILARAFEAAHRKVWFDNDLRGGEIWWDAILRNIRDCSVFLFAMSDHSLMSKPCIAELAYADALQRPILPVVVGSVAADRSHLLLGHQHVTFRVDDVVTGFEVLDAADNLAKRNAPLPDPLPPEPATPSAYLGGIRRKIEGSELINSAQIELISQLRASLGEATDVSEKRDILAMLAALYERPWRTKKAALEIRALFAANESIEEEEKPPKRKTEIPERDEAPTLTQLSEDAAREVFLRRFHEVVGELQTRRARQEARDPFGPLDVTDPPGPQPPIFGGIGGATGPPEPPKRAPEWAYRTDPEERTGSGAGVGSTGAVPTRTQAASPPATEAPRREADRPTGGTGSSVRETTIPTPATGHAGRAAGDAAGVSGGTAGAPTQPPTSVPLPPLIFARALAVAALVVTAAFAVVVTVVGRGSAVAVFALPAAAALVALGTSVAAAKRAAAGNEASARRTSILGVVWGVVAIAIGAVCQVDQAARRADVPVLLYRHLRVRAVPAAGR